MGVTGTITGSAGGGIAIVPLYLGAGGVGVGIDVPGGTGVLDPSFFNAGFTTGQGFLRGFGTSPQITVTVGATPGGRVSLVSPSVVSVVGVPIPITTTLTLPVPQPGTLTLLGLGLAGLTASARRRR